LSGRLLLLSLLEGEESARLLRRDDDAEEEEEGEEDRRATQTYFLKMIIWYGMESAQPTWIFAAWTKAGRQMAQYFEDNVSSDIGEQMRSELVLQALEEGLALYPDGATAIAGKFGGSNSVRLLGAGVEAEVVAFICTLSAKECAGGVLVPQITFPSGVDIILR